MLRLLNKQRKGKIRPLSNYLFNHKKQVYIMNLSPYLLKPSCMSHNPSVKLSGSLQPPLTFLSNPVGNMNRRDTKKSIIIYQFYI